MNFTNTNRMWFREVYWHMDEQEQVNDLMKWQVLCQIYKLSDEVYRQFIPTQTKIEQEINK